MSRNHLLEIVQVQDRIANGAKDIAGLMLGRKMRFPEEVNEALTRFVKASLDAVTLARKVMDELNDLVTTGFSGREIELIEKMLEELDVAEHESDVLQVKLRRALFDHEADLNPVSVIFLYRVIDQIGDIADDVSNSKLGKAYGRYRRLWQYAADPDDLFWLLYGLGGRC